MRTAWSPWAEGKATRIGDDKVVGTFALLSDYSDEGWRVTAIEADPDGVFVTATFEKPKADR